MYLYTENIQADFFQLSQYVNYPCTYFPFICMVDFPLQTKRNSSDNSRRSKTILLPLIIYPFLWRLTFHLPQIPFLDIIFLIILQRNCFLAVVPTSTYLTFNSYNTPLGSSTRPSLFFLLLTVCFFLKQLEILWL